MRASVRVEHAVAIVGMKRTDEQRSVGGPLLDGVAEQRLDLAAREDVGALGIELVHVHDERELFDEDSVAAQHVQDVTVATSSASIWPPRGSTLGIGGSSAPAPPSIG